MFKNLFIFSGLIIGLSGWCQNSELPERPSINKNLEQTTVTLDDRHGNNGEGTGKNKVLPFARQSLDGRLLYLATGNWSNYSSDVSPNVPQADPIIPTLMYVDPENYGSELTVRNQNPISVALPLHPIIYYAYNRNLTFTKFSEYSGNRMPPSYHLEICNDSGNTENPVKACSAWVNNEKTQKTLGDCYNVTLINIHGDTANPGSEIRSSKVTVFITNAKMKGRSERIYVYPREDITQTLPPLEYVKNLHSLGNPGSGKSNLEMLTKACVTSDGARPNDWLTRPYYCRFIYNQKFSKQMTLEGTKYVGRFPQAIGEPTITGDGKVIFANFMLGDNKQGIYYAKSEISCDIERWNNFKRLSRFPYDFSVANYLLSSSPFRDGVGRIIPAGENIAGAYPWVDRLGRNLFFAALNKLEDHHKDANGTTIYTQQGHGFTALGAWTNGKMINLDGNLNFSDFGHSFLVPAPVTVNLYQGGSTVVRSSSTTLTASVENIFNYFNHLAPTVPFDVVWRMGSDNSRNTQIIFDDYLLPNLVFGSHMNAPLTSYRNASGDSFYYQKNGYFPSDLNYSSGWKLVEDPVLQNIATSQKTSLGSRVPQSLQLKGGARVEPVANGGVFGKGVFLDGKDDAIIASTAGNKVNQLVINLWVDPRNLSTGKEKTLITFSDGMSIKTRIRLSPNYISAVIENSGKYQRIATPKILNNKFFHFSLKLETRPITGSTYLERVLTFYINGTKLAGPIESNISNKSTKLLVDKMTFPHSPTGNDRRIFSIGDQTGGFFAIGDPLKLNESVRGWFDELRVYEFPTQIGNVYKKIPKYFEEIICNQAYGSLVEVNSQDGSSSSLALQKIYKVATELKVIAKEQNTMGKDPNAPPKEELLPPLVCEQMEILGSPTNDFSDKFDSLCATSTHRLKNGIAADRCYREKIFNINDKPLIAGQPRPNFSQVPFCISCHQGGNFLNMEALKQGSVNRELDKRRQPLDIPRVYGGCRPDMDPFDSTSRCDNSTLLMDYIFDFNPKIE